MGSPLWSVRRVPQPITDAVGMAHLQTALSERVGTFAACFAVRDELGEIAQANADQPYIPASTLKLLTAAAALEALGPGFHFTTLVAAPSAPRNGTVDRLVMIGGGDPLLATPERIALDAQEPDSAGLATTSRATLADRIVETGVRSVPGGVVGVNDRYADTRDLPEWAAGARAAIGPIGALTVNDGYTGPAGTGPESGDPALNAATELSRLLVARGVSVGTPSSADRPGGSEIAAIDSPPLSEILTEMLSVSDNLTAEILVRELSAQAGGRGTPESGAREVGDTLERLGVDLTGTTIVDGSGLARADTVSCATLLQVLRLSTTPRLAAIRDGLAIAGERGTLATRLRGTPLAGNLRAKTGTLDGVSGLAGFVRSDRPLTFALLINGSFGESTAFALREAMAAEIAAFPSTVAGATLVPEPFAPVRTP